MEENKMVWLGKNTSYFAMVPGPTTISRGVGHIMEIQLWFSYNTTEAYEAGSLTPAPGIWMVIYDPEFDIKQMVADGQVYTSLFDANSHTASSPNSLSGGTTIGLDVAEAGAFFALVQFFSWIVSGMAWD
ncbi:hypothetical protein SNOG_16573 [Parastagonospora nodorum SN15]|uniref:Uncharacterized protein n=1 Tax=Phaeosphaeria nodorum (strain SN15 / ATCC MYA-4574 / FGSC 10173) TaxID=321614 RepID=Q0TVA2_PHANO|nr:hypothetical protein SNOG_16573 [Parastagonospora nodorum SN15]EAT76053.1 hypothetical protein SNOG_16573 [Parastagonospora nodorum SN15]